MPQLDDGDGGSGGIKIAPLAGAKEKRDDIEGRKRPSENVSADGRSESM